MSASPRLEAVRSRLGPVLTKIAEGALARELDGELPADQVEWLKAAGVGALRVPVEFGGAGLSLPEVAQVWIDVAAADNNLAQALRGHAAFAEDRLFHHRRGQSQADWFARFVAGEIAGNAWSETGSTAIDTQQTILTPLNVGVGEGYRLDGQKFYSTGSIFAEWIDVYARHADGHFVIALVSTDQDGVEIFDDWDGFGQRGTGSGTVVFDGAHVHAVDVIDFSDRFGYQTALYQLNLLATLAGIARSALADVVSQVQQRERNYSHANAARVRDDPQVLARVGEIASAVYAAEAITLRVAEALQEVFEATLATSQELDRLNEAAELATSQAQVVVTDLVLKATSDLFDTLGASATARSKGLDRHWRNARTVSSHNPRILKATVVGGNLVNGTPPPYAWAIGTTQRDSAGERKATAQPA